MNPKSIYLKLLAFAVAGALPSFAATPVPAALTQAIQQTLGPAAATQNAAYQQQQELTAADGATSDAFGYSVKLSVDGHTALIGAPFKNNHQGIVYVFTAQANTWTEQQELIASDPATGDDFGQSLTLSGDGLTALIGAPGKNRYHGAAYVFTLQSGAWTEQQELTASDGATGEAFGQSVALDNDGRIALIGTPGKNSVAGAVYVFTAQANTWTQQQELTASDAAPVDDFGYSVALNSDGHIALVGAPNKNSATGAAYVFTGQANSYTQQQELTASDAAPADDFGYSVALNSDGHIALIGAPGKNGYQGAAYVFTAQANSYTQQQELMADGGRDVFGDPVALSGDGRTALIGAVGENGYQGAAYVFTQQANTWIEQQVLTASDGAPNDRFGGSVALSGNGQVTVIGAAFKNSLQGAAYVFTNPAVPFSSFKAYLAIDTGKHPGFALTSTFTLGSGTTGLQPANEAMMLEIANYTLTLPAGSFHKLWNAANAPYGYEGTVNGAKLVLGIVPLGHNAFSFEAAGSPVSFTGVKNPVTITLTFGSDSGTASVNALFTSY